MTNRNEITISYLEKICEQANALENIEIDLYANSPIKDYGKFIVETMLIEMSFSEDEMESITSKNSENLDLKRKFVQAWKHEYCHLLQCILYPSAVNYARVKRNYLKIESGILIKAVENKCRWSINSKNKTIVSIISSGAYKPAKLMRKDIEESIVTHTEYSQEFTFLGKGKISFLHILEGMAHELSKSHRDNSHIDELSIDDNPLYNTAYEYFLSKGGDLIDGVFLKKITFCYFCYFSLSYSYPKQVVNAFIDYCDNLPDYFSAMRYKVSKEIVFKEIEKYEYWLNIDTNLLNQSIDFIRPMMFFINNMRKDFDEKNKSNPYINTTKLSYDELERQRFAFPKNIAIQQDYIVLIFITQPEVFWAWTMKMRDIKNISYPLGDSEVMMENEQDFYKFVLNFRSLLKINNYWCCEQHGFNSDFDDLLVCGNKDSYQQMFFDLTGEPLKDVFDRN